MKQIGDLIEQLNTAIRPESNGPVLHFQLDPKIATRIIQRWLASKDRKR